MGNWRNRPRFYRQRAPRSPSRSYHARDSPPHVFSDDDGVPEWEKKFCYFVGSIPWRKIVESRSFMGCHGNVINWDDSAGEEAFHNAKKRFWSEMNGLPCDISLPDPDMYIDDVNWNSLVDPELIKDLEREYFAPPDEGRIDFKSGRKNKKTRNSRLVPVKECDHGDTINKPWECNNGTSGNDLLGTNISQGWNQWDTSVNNCSKDSNNIENPWERNATLGKEIANNCTWGDSAGKGWENNGWRSTGWENNGWGSKGCENNGWGSKGWDNSGDNSWGPERHDSSKLNYAYNSHGRRGFVQNRGAARENGLENSGANARGWEPWGTSNTEKRWEFRRSSDTWRDLDGNSLKREVDHGYGSGYRNSRFKRNDNRTGNDWRNEKANKRFAFSAK